MMSFLTESSVEKFWWKYVVPGTIIFALGAIGLGVLAAVAWIVRGL